MLGWRRRFSESRQRSAIVLGRIIQALFTDTQTVSVASPYGASTLTPYKTS